MEFYVVDPKEITFADWSEKMRDFFAAESLSFTESTGDLYYVGDDVAVAWDEASVLFTVDGDEGGGGGKKGGCGGGGGGGSEGGSEGVTGGAGAMTAGSDK